MDIRAIIHCAVIEGYEPILNELIEACEQHTNDIYVCYVSDLPAPRLNIKYKQVQVGELGDYELKTLDTLIKDSQHGERVYLYCHTKGVYSQQHQWRRNMIKLTINNAPLYYFIQSEHNMMGSYYYPIQHYKHFGGNFFWIKSEFAKSLQKPTEIKDIWEKDKRKCCIFENTCNIDNHRMIAEFFYGQQAGFNPLVITTSYNIVNEANLPI